MKSRRDFIKTTGIATLGVLAGQACTTNTSTNGNVLGKVSGPLVISTWRNLKANEAAWEIISRGGRALDAVENGVMVAENDPDDMSVG